MDSASDSRGASATVASTSLPLELSPDVVIHILSFLYPVDIFSMRKTCQSFYRASKARAVWLTALDQTCDRYGIFKPTYPKNAMTTFELEHASLAPHLFINLMKAYDGSADSLAYQTRTIHRGPSLDADRSRIAKIDVLSVYLVPGGRFLFTSGRGADALCLWDIGYNAYARMKLSPIAKLQEGTVAEDRFPSVIKCVGPSMDGRSLVIAMQGPLSAPPSQPKDMISIYRIDPRSSKPVFRLEGCLKPRNVHAGVVSELLECVFLTHDYIFVYDMDSAQGQGGFFVLWNWINKTGLKWRAGLSGRLKINSIHVSERSIIVCDKGRVLIWDVPALQPIADTPGPIQDMNQIPLAINMPKTFNPSPFHRAVSTRALCGTSIWQRHRAFESDEHLCLFLDTSVISQYVIQRTPATYCSLLPCGVSRGLSHSEDRDSEVTPLFNNENHLVFCSISGDGRLVANAIPLLPTPTDNGKANSEFQQMRLGPMSIHLMDDDREEDVEMINELTGFCPMSGRLVYIWGVNYELRISDLLLPPDQ